MRSDCVDLTGKRFGKLTAIDYKDNKWICRCDCGNIRKVRSWDLKNNKALACIECSKVQKIEDKRIKLEGTEIWDWTVIKYLGNKKYLCRCKCGAECEVFTQNLLRGISKSCVKCSQLDKLADLSGLKFGKLTALRYTEDKKWECMCDCGNIVNVLAGNLTSGNSTQCDECRKKAHIKDITGQKFNQLTAIKYLGYQWWLCRCSCGKFINARGYNLRVGFTKSCGHDQKNSLIDIKGKTFNEWTVLEYSGNNYWKCQCSCGTIKDIHGYELRTYRAKSCGCKKGLYARNTLMERYGECAPIKVIRGTERMPEQIEAIESRENLIKYISKIGYPPTTYEVAKLLGLGTCHTLKIIHKYSLEQFVDIFSSVSSYEIDIYEYLRTLTDEEIITSDRTVLDGKELDIYIPSKRLAIEFNGTYWHSTLYKEPKYHQQKSMQCIEKGIRLIHIFEYEWVDDKQRLKIKSLLKNTISDTDVQKISARKCEIDTDLQQSEADEFLNNYHLQNSAPCQLRYGLRYNNELVGVMTFGKPRFNNEYEWELIRLAWKDGYRVVGGAYKLYNKFLEDCNPNSVISYCNIGKFTGNIYNMLNFNTTENSLTSPNYVWVEPSDNEVLTRYQTQKQKLLDSGLGMYGDTEREIMENIGYMQIFDAGNMRYSWIKN